MTEKIDKADVDSLDIFIISFRIIDKSTSWYLPGLIFLVPVL
jgi:hypothetical protein